MSVFVMAEHRNGKLRPVTAELLALARSLDAGPVTALLLGAPDSTASLAPIAEELRPWADKVATVEQADLEGNGAGVAALLVALAKGYSPKLILGAHSAAGMDWAPTLATKLAAPIVTDVVALAVDGDGFRATRAVYGGKLQAQVRTPGATTTTITLRPGAVEAEETPGAPCEVEAFSPAPVVALGKRFLRWVEEAAGDVDITQADILVSVGRGIGDPEDMDVARNLAEALGATLSCSRPVVDSGWLPKGHQVGISGKTVKPKVYIALGISGAFQHVTAMKEAGTIIAVNKDPKAPIFRVAHYGIVGDLFKVVPALTAAAQAAKAPA